MNITKEMGELHRSLLDTAEMNKALEKQTARREKFYGCKK